MANIVTTDGAIAFTPESCPGTGSDDASDEQLRERAAKMNAKAEALGIQTRYEVK